MKKDPGWAAEQLKIMNESFRLNDFLSKATQTIVLVYQGIAALIFIASLVAGYTWLQKPFIGGFFEQTMVMNDAETREAGKQWSLSALGFQPGDQLVSVNGQSISSARDQIGRASCRE